MSDYNKLPDHGLLTESDRTFVFVDNKHNIKDPKLDDYFQGCLYFTLSKLNKSINRMAEDAFKELELAPSHAFF